MPSNKLNVVTGATGQLGSHIVEQLQNQGKSVRALVRSNSDISFLKSLNAELVTVDYQNAESMRQGVAGADIVYHCAARVSDWGSWPIFQTEVVDVAGNVFAACGSENVGRVLFVSSISVYGHPTIKPGQLITEEDPLGQNPWLWDHYAKAKIESEKLARQYQGDITIVRPSWIYGPRDRVTIPRVVPALRSQKVPIIGSGDNVLNLIFAGDVARGCILAANHQSAAGQAYNLSSQGELTQRQMIDTLTDLLELPRVGRRVPFALVMRVAFAQESFARLVGKKTPPRITRRAVYLIGRPAQFSIEKAREELGWAPEIGIQDGLRQTLAWYWESEKAAKK